MFDLKLKKQLIRFIISGCLAVFVDCMFYYILSYFLDISIAKAISFLIGTIAAFLMNKYYTFEQKKKSFLEAIKFLSLYLFSLGANVVVNKLSFIILPYVFDNFEIRKLFAFLFATATSTIINFLGQKFWVFRLKEEKQ